MNDIVKRLRENAELIPHELYTWLNPLLLEAAGCLERAGSPDFEQVFGFLNSIEGAGYGGMAEYEIARETMRRAAHSRS